MHMCVHVYAQGRYEPAALRKTFQQQGCRVGGRRRRASRRQHAWGYGTCNCMREYCFVRQYVCAVECVCACACAVGIFYVRANVMASDTQPVVRISEVGHKYIRVVCGLEREQISVLVQRTIERGKDCKCQFKHFCWSSICVVYIANT